MEQLLTIFYSKFIDEEDCNTTEACRVMNQKWEKIEKALDELKKLLSEDIFNNLQELIWDGAADIQCAGFIMGFSYCARFLTDGKVDFFPSNYEKGGNE